MVSKTFIIKELGVFGGAREFGMKQLLGGATKFAVKRLGMEELAFCCNVCKLGGGSGWVQGGWLEWFGVKRFIM
jgi:hypothetical protein